MGPASGPRATTRTASPQNDIWIAACCLVDDLPLATLNVKDVTDFVEHEGLTLIGGQEL
jgi:toxin FitB